MLEKTFSWLEPMAGSVDQPMRENPLTMELYNALEGAYAKFARKHPGEFSFGDVSPALFGFMAHAFSRMYGFPAWTIKQDVTWEQFCQATVQSFADGLKKETIRG